MFYHFELSGVNEEPFVGQWGLQNCLLASMAALATVVTVIGARRQKIAVAALLTRIARGIRTLAGKGHSGVFRRGDIVWELDLKEGIDLAIYLQGGFEPETVRDYRRVVQMGVCRAGYRRAGFASGRLGCSRATSNSSLCEDGCGRI